MAGPRRWSDAQLVGALVAVVGAILVGIYVSYGAIALPTAREAEQELAKEVGASGSGTLRSATCEPPGSSSMSCRLRDDAGRYGYADVTLLTDHVAYRWEFPVPSDGRVGVPLRIPATADGPDDVGAYLLMALRPSLRAVGLDVRDRPRCPDAAVGQTVTCPAAGPLPEQQLTHITGDYYQYRVTLPAPQE